MWVDYERLARDVISRMQSRGIPISGDAHVTSALVEAILGVVFEEIERSVKGDQHVWPPFGFNATTRDPLDADRVYYDAATQFAGTTLNEGMHIMLKVLCKAVQDKFDAYHGAIQMLADQVTAQSVALQGIAPPEPERELAWICYCGATNATGHACRVCDRREHNKP